MHMSIYQRYLDRLVMRVRLLAHLEHGLLVRVVHDNRAESRCLRVQRLNDTRTQRQAKTRQDNRRGEERRGEVEEDEDQTDEDEEERGKAKSPFLGAATTARQVSTAHSHGVLWHKGRHTEADLLADEVATRGGETTAKS